MDVSLLSRNSKLLGWHPCQVLLSTLCGLQTTTVAYGAFCDIKATTDGLIHISQLQAHTQLGLSPFLV